MKSWLHFLSNIFIKTIHHHSDNGDVVMSKDDLVSFFKKAQHSYQLNVGLISIDKLHGEKISPYSGHGLDYSESRYYTPGDDIRTINWKQSARTDQLITKKFHQENENIDYLILDQRHAMFFGTLSQPKMATAIKLGIISVIGSLNSRKTIRIISMGNKIEISPVLDNYEKILSFFTNVAKRKVSGESHIQPDFLAALKCMQSIKPIASSITFISDFHDLSDKEGKYIKSLCSANNVMLYHVQDHIEKSLPNLFPVNYQSLNGDKSVTLSSRTELKAFIKMIESDNLILSELLSSLPTHLNKIENTINDNELLHLQVAQWM